MAISNYYLIPPLPKGLEGLAEVGLDLRWSWSHATDPLWDRIDPELWNLTRNPWLILQSVSSARLKALSQDPAFMEQVDEHLKEHRKDSQEPCWFPKTHDKSPLTVAYFSMEFGLSEALPIYSGGLGILAGDHLKTASDLGVPLVGIGLLYQQGYFRQVIDAGGNQMEFYPYNDPSQLPILPVLDREGEWLRIGLNFPGRRVRLRVWEAKVGRVKLYLLDSNDPANSPADQCITAELYGGGLGMRLQQEIALGIGGWRLLRVLGIEAEVCHLNEGHAALAVIERARSFMEDTGQPFEVALATTRAGNIFTTHTPVEAGFDRFSPVLVDQYLGAYADRLGIGLDGLLALGRQDPRSTTEPLNMAYLAIRGSSRVNGVSRLHGEVSRRIFQPLFPHWPQPEVPVTHVTNGVHMPSWDSAAADALWSEACGKKRWLGTLSSIEADLKLVPDETLWALRNEGCRHLIQYARERLARQLEAAGASKQEILETGKSLDPHAFTMGFARRFATYKRPNLLLHDSDRLARLLQNTDQPIQLIITGKAHPRDGAGKVLIRAWSDFIRRPEVCSRVIFLADYDMSLAERLVQGIDLWINTPRRPWEASGTSGMKVLVNGGLNLSELDGWWAEAYHPEVGWALGDGREHGEDPVWDAREAEQLYRLLEEEAIPAFYDRDSNGIPKAWVARMRLSMAELTPRFSTNRMVREYVERLYLPAGLTYCERAADKGAVGRQMVNWQQSLEQKWAMLRFGEVKVETDGEHHVFEVRVYLNDLNPKAVRVELYADGVNGDNPVRQEMTHGRKLVGAAGGYVYSARVPATRPATDYTARVIPYCFGVAVPLEAARILWQR
jgi:starch phosphorylase